MLVGWENGMFESSVAVIGAGLAGCECALRLARYGINVTLFEQKPYFHSGAHTDDGLAELVCSNSFRSAELTSAIGLLKNEMLILKSDFMEIAASCRVPAGKALAVDRKLFSELFTERVQQSPHIRLVRKRVDSLRDHEVLSCGPAGIVIAAGPLAADNIADSLKEIIGLRYCHFYDAIAPIIWSSSLDMKVAFRASRYESQKEGSEYSGDYLNCPMTKDEYFIFYEALRTAKTIQAHLSEEERYFEGCMPLEELARRGPRTLSFGPFKPVGLTDPRTGKRPWAVLQLRSENANADTCNLVGCQTKMIQSEQARVFRLIPGMENVEFARFGSMHRNTYVNAPEVLAENLSLKQNPRYYVAGQLCGVEGYVESAATGLWVGIYLGAKIRGNNVEMPPVTCALGSLLHYLRTPSKNFQPSNANFGIMPALDDRVSKKDRKTLYSRRAQHDFFEWIDRFAIGYQ